MPWLVPFAHFFGGFFMANAVPHMVSGMMGRPFQKPPGQGLSSSTVNVVWGACNLVASYLLIYRVGHFDPRNSADILASGAGALLISLFSARHFGRFNGGHAPTRS